MRHTVVDRLLRMGVVGATSFARSSSSNTSSPLLFSAPASGEPGGDDTPSCTFTNPRHPVTHLHFEEVDSTHKWCMRNQELLVSKYGLRPGRWVAVSATRQTAGVGTRDPKTQEERKWHTAPHNVCVTYVVPWPRAKRPLMFHFAQVTTSSVAQALESYGLAPRIKWINDVLVDGRKISGTLCTAPGWELTDPRSGDTHDVVLIGVGVNVNHSEEQLRNVGQPATSILCSAVQGSSTERDLLRHVVGRENGKGQVGGGGGGDMGPRQEAELEWYAALPPPPEGSLEYRRVFMDLTDNMHRNFMELRVGGFNSCFLYVDERLAMRGETVVVDPEAGGDEPPARGRLAGLHPDGALKLIESTGNVLRLTTGRLRKG
eukprot:GHVU01149281.1.p1 GENE.GHVU01149281.1~~GHVU01149281.1.p1  ORF type:complete len:374 (+),score=63.63 GHVU01149281.1:314-1435(+)